MNAAWVKITKLLKNDYDITDVDIGQDYVDYTRKTLHVETKCCDLSQKAYFHEKFDAAFSLNVLEHIENQKQMLLNINRALKPDGNLVILVPAFNWLYGKFDKAIFHHSLVFLLLLMLKSQNKQGRKWRVVSKTGSQ